MLFSYVVTYFQQGVLEVLTKSNRPVVHVSTCLVCIHDGAIEQLRFYADRLHLGHALNY